MYGRPQKLEFSFIRYKVNETFENFQIIYPVNKIISNIDFSQLPVELQQKCIEIGDKRFPYTNYVSLDWDIFE